MLGPDQLYAALLLGREMKKIDRLSKIGPVFMFVSGYKAGFWKRSK
jgi:hypothetical protein